MRLNFHLFRVDLIKNIGFFLCHHLNFLGASFLIAAVIKLNTFLSEFQTNHDNNWQILETILPLSKNWTELDQEEIFKTKINYFSSVDSYDAVLNFFIPKAMSFLFDKISVFYKHF